MTSAAAPTSGDASPPDGATTPRLAVLCACLLMLAALVDSQVVGAIAPQVAAGVGASKAAVAASVTVYSIAAACVAFILARRGGSVRPAAWLPLAAGAFVAGGAVAAAAPHVSVFWAGRAVAGLAGGFVSALVIAALADASSYARRGRQMSGVAVCYFVAPVAGVPLAAWLAGRAGWRAVFVTVAVLTALAGLLVRLFPLASARRDGDAARRDDDVGARRDVDVEVSRRDVDVEASRRDVDGREAAGGKISLWRLMMRTRSTRRGIVSAFFVSGGLVALTTYLGAWLSDAFGATAGQVGAIYAVAGAGAVAGGLAGGALSDRVGKRRVAAASSLWLALAVVLLPTFAWGAGLWAVTCLTAFLAALRVAPLQALVTEVVAPSERATYVALRNAASQLGIAAAVAAGGRIYQGRGLFGVGLLSAVLTLLAWLSVRKMEDPHAARSAAADEGGQGSATDERPGATGERLSATGEALNRTGEGQSATNDPAGASGAGAGARGRTHPSRFARVARKLAAAVLVVALVVMLVLPWLLSFAITKAGTRPDERARTDTPAAHGAAAFEDVTFNSADGVRLSGWYLPSRGRGVSVVLTHGLFRSRYETLERGLALAREGYGVLLYDLRRHGRSAGEFSSVGYYERRDVEAAFRYAREREPENRVVLMGVSMGAAATLLAAAETRDDKLLAVVAESSFLSFEDTARHHVGLTPLPTFPFAGLLIKFTGWRLGFDPQDFDVLRAVGRLDRPVLFVGAGEDRRMPTATVLEPLRAASRHPLSRKFVVEGATHGRAYDRAPGQYTAAVLDFLRAVEGR